MCHNMEMRVTENKSSQQLIVMAEVVVLNAPSVFLPPHRHIYVMMVSALNLVAFCVVV